MKSVSRKVWSGTNRRTLFIINPVAGAGQGLVRWKRCERLLREWGIPAEQAITSSSSEPFQIAAKAADEYDLVVAVGGDGMAAEVASGLLSRTQRRASLGLVPFGTGNDFARLVGVRNEEDARQALAGVNTRTVDVIAIRCTSGGEPMLRHALLFAGVGVVSECVKATTPRVKQLLGQRLAYPYGIIRALWNYQCPTMSLDCDGRKVEQELLFVGVSNGETFGGGIRIAPGARLDDGLLNINIVESAGKWEALRELGRLRQGKHTNHPRVRYFTARSLSVETSVPIEVAADGDVVGWTPATFEVRPSALQVLVA